MASHLKDLINIGPRTSLFTPLSPAPGQLIILCTWLGAARKHIAKYTSLYQDIAPAARILLIESNVPILISSYSHQRNVIKPAVDAVLDTLTQCDSRSIASKKTATSNRIQPNGQPNGSMTASARSTNPPTPKIILHTFSNGGTNTATQLLLVLRAHLHSPFPLAGLLCDSCPANGTYWKSYDAMVLSLPKDIASRILGALACHCILILLYSWIACGNENPASLNRRTMLDGAIVGPPAPSGCDDGSGGGGGEAKRRVWYFYSKADRMCQWTDVREHGEEARRRAWRVEEVVFEESGHCAHLPNDEDRYARAVRRAWA
ncbi:MAG: hypothetical protein M1816_006578 [Peltula sp. TS41687]|nr:MAG: hypothetical protein M1816_006578 [Peltula sp. TS41687]